MTHIKTRNPAGGEYSFYSRAEFVRAIERGGLSADWQVFHAASGRWLPISAHPAYAQTVRKRESTGERSPRTSDLILIYPEDGKGAPKHPAPAPDPVDHDGPVLAPDEIDRVLRPRDSNPHPTIQPPERRWSAAVPRTSAPSMYRLQEADFHAGEAGASVLQRVLIAGVVLLLLLAAISAARVKSQHPAPTSPAAAQPAPRSTR
jgi:hypothetical protein